MPHWSSRACSRASGSCPSAAIGASTSSASAWRPVTVSSDPSSNRAARYEGRRARACRTDGLLPPTEEVQRDGLAVERRHPGPLFGQCGSEPGERRLRFPLHEVADAQIRMSGNPVRIGAAEVEVGLDATEVRLPGHLEQKRLELGSCSARVAPLELPEPPPESAGLPVPPATRHEQENEKQDQHPPRGSKDEQDQQQNEGGEKGWSDQGLARASRTFIIRR
jgi:hypothetical protein